MPEYTITLPSGKTERCTRPGNCRRHGAYANTAVPVGGADRAAFLQDVQHAHTPEHLREGVRFPPIAIANSPLSEPRNNVSAYSLEYTYDTGSSNPEYGYYGDDSDGNDDEPSGSDMYDMNRDSTIENLQIQSVNLPAVLGDIFNTHADNIPKPLVAHAEQLGFADPDAWYIHVEGGYYGEEIGHAEFLHPKKVEELRDWYWTLPNAVDKDGILNYCRGKGLDTTGLNPLAAIKAQLAQENPGIPHRGVENASKVTSARLNHNQVAIPRMDRYAEIVPLPAAVPPELRGTGTNAIIGVAYRHGGAYRLVDGYHRYKDAHQQHKRNGRYIILDR